MEEFTKVVDRLNTNCIKWDQRKEIFQTDSEELLPLWIADMDFPAPKEVNEALIKRAKHGIYGYTYIPDPTKQQVINWLLERHDWDVQPNAFIFSPSVITSLYNAITTFTNKGDRILIQTPVYTPFFNVIEEAGREIVTNPLYDNGTSYEIDFDDLEKKMQDGVKAFVLCSPHNPVGRVWTREELTKIANLALQYNVLILSDEIHADLVFAPHKHIPIASLSEKISDQTITLMSPTKTFNLAGLQISYAITTCKHKRRKLANALAIQGFRSLNTMGIVALDAAYRHGHRWLEELLHIVEKNKQYVLGRLQEETNGKVRVYDAEGTYLLWIDFSKLGFEDQQLQRFLIDKAKVGLNAGSSYGKDGEQFMRINIACHRETLKEAIDRIVNAIKEV